MNFAIACGLKVNLSKDVFNVCIDNAIKAKFEVHKFIDLVLRLFDNSVTLFEPKLQEKTFVPVDTEFYSDRTLIDGVDYGRKQLAALDDCCEYKYRHILWSVKHVMIRDLEET
eukprot:UN24097